MSTWVFAGFYDGRALGYAKCAKPARRQQAFPRLKVPAPNRQGAAIDPTPPYKGGSRFCEDEAERFPSPTSLAAHCRRQDSPSGAKSRSTLASRLSIAMREITVEPKPRLAGAVTGGPPCSRQLITKVSSSPSSHSRLHPTSRRPSLLESAPYLPALVASSCRAMPMVWAAEAEIKSGGPCSAIRVPVRSLKCASWDRTSSSISTPLHSFLTSRSWLADMA